MSPKPRESKATLGRCGEPGRVFRLPGGGGGRSAYAGGVSWGGPLLPGHRRTGPLYLAARGFAVARSRAHVERQAKSAAPAAAT